MTEKLRAWLPLAPLLLLLAGVYWLNQQVLPLQVRSDGSKRHDPDVIAHEFKATTLDAAGQPHYHLSAREMVHYPDDDSLHFENPQLLSLSPGQPALRTTALTGISYHRNETILRGDVRMVRGAHASASERVFNTTYLRVLPDQDYAETDRPVSMRDANTLITATGMALDNRKRVISLLSQIRSEHVATP